MKELYLVDEWISGFARERKCPMKILESGRLNVT